MRLRSIGIPLLALLSGYWLVYDSASRQPPPARRLRPFSSHASNVEVEPLSASISLAVLANPMPTSPALDEETLQCVKYSGPCFFMNHRTGVAPTMPIAAAKLPSSIDSQPTLRPLRLPLAPFSLHNVSLAPGTRFYTAQRTNVDWLRQLEPDRLLYYFRNLSHLAQPAGVKPHGGWDGAGTGLRGHIVGHYLSAASMAAAATGDALLLHNLDLVTRGLEECQQALGESGYLSGFSQSEFQQMEDFPAPPYAWVPYCARCCLLHRAASPEPYPYAAPIPCPAQM